MRSDLLGAPAFGAASTAPFNRATTMASWTSFLAYQTLHRVHLTRWSREPTVTAGLMIVVTFLAGSNAPSTWNTLCARQQSVNKGIQKPGDGRG
jgi:hypothetical protein